MADRELVFTFQVDDDGRERFVASGNVVANIREQVTKGRIAEAAELYASSNSSVGDALLEELRSGASRRLVVAFAEMFHTARDFQRAAQCAELVGDKKRAANLHEAAYDYKRSGEHYVDVGMYEKAAEAAERSGDFRTAANLYLEMGRYDLAGDNFERCEEFLEAGRNYLRAKSWQAAVQALQQVPRTSESDFRKANWLLGNIFERNQKFEVAARYYLTVCHKQAVGEETVGAFYRLGLIYQAAGHVPEARHLLGLVRSYDEDYEDVADRLGDLPTTLHDEEEEEIVDLGEPIEEPVVRVDPDFTVMGKLALFQDMSLDELRVIYSMCDKRILPADSHIIRQGREGEGLFVVIEGGFEVNTLDAMGDVVVLDRIGPGGYVGEMSLLDNEATSANVRTVESTRFFVLTRERMQHLLLTDDRIAVRFYRRFISDLSRRLRDANRRL
ncbi:MAG: cyclic nucleotide-binding domain-containing protein [Myxococcales bacterium]|nr:cyclic nucleotide-binding domain-containing protein [Myxococcales bacterium]